MQLLKITGSTHTTLHWLRIANNTFLKTGVGSNYNLVEYEGAISICKLWVSNNRLDRMNLFQSVFNRILYEDAYYRLDQIFVVNNFFQDALNGVLFSLYPPESESKRHYLSISEFRLENLTLANLYLGSQRQCSLVYVQNIRAVDANATTLVQTLEGVGFNFTALTTQLVDTVTLQHIYASHQTSDYTLPAGKTQPIIKGSNFKLATLTNSTFRRIRAQNKQLLQFDNYDVQLQQTVSALSIDSCQFQQLALSSDSSYDSVSCLYISSPYGLNVTITNSSFEELSLTAVLNANTESAAGVIAQAIKSQLNITHSHFSQSVSNSNYNLIYCKIYALAVLNSTFNGSNFLQQPISTQRKSSGGFVYAALTTMQIRDSTFSFADTLQGGAFYVKAQSARATLSLDGCAFLDIFAQSQGAVLYVERLASYVALTVNNSTFTNIYNNELHSSLFYLRERLDNATNNEIQIKGSRFTNVYGHSYNSILSTRNAEVLLLGLRIIQDSQTA